MMEKLKKKRLYSGREEDNLQQNIFNQLVRIVVAEGYKCYFFGLLIFPSSSSSCCSIEVELFQ